MGIVDGRKIQSITVVSGAGVGIYKIGDSINGLIIDYISDNSMEYPDGIEFIYHCFDADHKLIVEMDNCPVVVEYKAG